MGFKGFIVDCYDTLLASASSVYNCLCNHMLDIHHLQQIKRLIYKFMLKSTNMLRLQLPKKTRLPRKLKRRTWNVLTQIRGHAVRCVA